MRKFTSLKTEKTIQSHSSLKSSSSLQGSTGLISTRQLTPKQKPLSSKVDELYSVRRLEALERDGHACQRCGSTFAVAPHHRLPRSSSHLAADFGFDSIHDLRNLITLCVQCHTWVHSGDIAEVTADGWLIVPSREAS